MTTTILLPRSGRVALRLLMTAIVALAVALPAPALGAVDPDAEIIELRTSCTVGGNAIDDCFTTMSTVLSWISDTRQPTKSTPLLVRIGPGSFGPYSCTNSGWISLQGAGREHTIVGAGATHGATVANCQDLGFSDLTVRGDEIGVTFNGNSSSTWNNADLIGGKTSGESAQPVYAWLDGFGSQLHYLFGTRLIAEASHKRVAAASSGFAEVWFYGGDVVVRGTPNTPAEVEAYAAATLVYQADWRFFGTTIRAVLGDATHMKVVLPISGIPSGFGGIFAVGGAKVHLHGSIVSVDASGADPLTNYDALGIGSFNAGMVHTPGTAFVVKAAGSGQVVRVTGQNVQSPFLWQAGTEPPVAGLDSLVGQDLYVETDCNATSCSIGSNRTDPHLMIYKPDCTNSPWFDVVRGVCRD